MSIVFPTTPTLNQVFTSGNRSWTWNGIAWQASRQQTIYSATAPTNPVSGMIWVDTSVLTEYNYYEGVWVETEGAGNIQVIDTPHNNDSSLSFDRTNGALQTCNLLASGVLTATGGAAGQKLELWITASGADRTVSLAGFTLPSESTFTGPKTLLAGKMYIFLLRYTGAAWLLVAIEGGF